MNGPRSKAEAAAEEADQFRPLEGTVPYHAEDGARYRELGWWEGLALSEYLDRAAGIHPHKTAFVDLRTRLTYSQARDTAERAALGFLGLGIKPLDRVLLQLPNWNEVVAAYFGLQKIGAIPVMLIDRYRQAEVQRLAEITGATAWIVPASYGKTDYLPIIGDVLDSGSHIERVITVRGDAPGLAAASLERLIAENEITGSGRARLAALKPDARQVAHMGPTGGTTGTPKVVPRTHNSLGATARFCSLAWQLHCEDTGLIVGSIGHDLSYTKGFLGNVVTMGTLVLLDNTDMRVVCETIEREKVTAVVWVPTLAQRLLHFEGLDEYDLSSLEKMHSGGGAALPTLVRGVSERLGVRFANGYGATEGMTTVTRPVDDIDTVCATVGIRTCPADLYRVVDAGGATLPPDTPGELVLKGPGVFTGYYRNDAENAKVFDADGFFHTGDVAKMSADGYVTITGRLKEMINRGGESISATQVEDLIDRHPDVVCVAVVAMPDPVMGERVCAYIQPKAGTTCTFDEVVSFLRAEKASVLSLPERVEFIEKMPYTAAQKIDKNALRADIEAKLTAEGAAGSGPPEPEQDQPSSTTKGS
ncbi:MAG: AMP-binding protein [Thermoleophilia bacterium]|nr:AMP-binding protein [Thermoleophilia bacterium]